MENFNNEMHPLLRRAIIFLENKDWGTADDYCERYLDADPGNAYAYVIKLMARVKVAREEDLVKAEQSFSTWNSYETACKFADEDLRRRLEGYANAVENRILSEERKQKEEAIAKENESRYQKALIRHNSKSVGDLEEALKLYKSIFQYKNVSELYADCETKLKIRLEEIRLVKEEAQKRVQQEQRKKVIVTWSVILSIAALVSVICFAINRNNQIKAQEIKKKIVGITLSASYMNGVKENHGGPVTTLSEVTEYDVTYTFYDDGTIKTHTDERYDKEPFLTKNGERQWDRERSYTGSKTWGEINVSFTGKITIDIDGVPCDMEVYSNNTVKSITINGNEYN